MKGNDKNDTNNEQKSEPKNEKKTKNMIFFEFWQFKKSKTNHDELVIDLKKLAQFLYRNDFSTIIKTKIATF